MDGGIQRGIHILKAFSPGAKAVGLDRAYLYPLSSAGQPGVECALALLQTDSVRGMKLMGCQNVGEPGRENLRFK